MSVEAVLARRRAERAALLERAKEFAEGLERSLGVRAVIVVGSVARGDFNRWSDIDVLVVADHLPDRLLERLESLEPRPPLVEPHPFTPAEWHARQARRDPMVTEAHESGVWLVGSAEALDAGADKPLPD